MVQGSGAADGMVRLWQIKRGMGINKTLEMVGAFPAPGYVNALAIASSGRFALAGLGQEPRLGRWGSQKTARSGILMQPLIVGIEWDWWGANLSEGTSLCCCFLGVVHQLKTRTIVNAHASALMSHRKFSFQPIQKISLYTFTCFIIVTMSIWCFLFFSIFRVINDRLAVWIPFQCGRLSFDVSQSLQSKLASSTRPFSTRSLMFNGLQQYIEYCLDSVMLFRISYQFERYRPTTNTDTKAALRWAANLLMESAMLCKGCSKQQTSSPASFPWMRTRCWGL